MTLIITGIYKIENKTNGRFYIGSSNHILKRWNSHRRTLEKGTHHNYMLQNAWNKYGSESFLFEVLEKCDRAVKFEREQHYIDTLKPSYNIAKEAGSPPNTDKKPVRRINVKTGEVKLYESIASVEFEGFHCGSVWKCCHGLGAFHLGYKWEFVNEESPEFVPKPGNERAVIRYDLETGEQIKRYSSAAEATKEGYSKVVISRCCNGLSYSHRGYGWRFEDGSSPVVESWGPETRKVVSYDPMTGKDIKYYNSIADTENDGFTSSKVIRCCKGERNTHSKLGWRYVEDAPRIFDSIREIKAVESYDLDTGATIKVYDNAYQASLEEGLNCGNLRECLYRVRRQCGNVGWRYQGEDYIAPKNKTVKTGEVVCLSKDGEEIKRYSYLAAVKSDGFDACKVGECCRGKRKSHKGFVWKLADERVAENVM